MKIAMIGAGNVGRALGGAFLRAGHGVIYGVREPSAARTVALEQGGAEVRSVTQAVAQSDAVLLCTPWAAVRDVLTDIGDLGGRTLLDATNPIGPGLSPVFGPQFSGAEQVQEWAPTAKVVKIFNTTGAETMAHPEYLAGPAMMPYAGDDAGAKESAARLATGIGFDAVDAGPLRNARLLEPLALLWINLAMMQGHGRGIAFGLMRRDA